MFRKSLRFLTTRTPGYVFWRQRTLIELEKSKRSHLLSERPFPVAEITRRMVRTRTKYAATEDFHEHNLLRGEYKYFSGKLLDLRNASVSDMISFIESAEFFGFWDTAQLDRVVDELNLHLSDMTSNELVHLLSALSGVRKHPSPLYRSVATELVPLVDDLPFEDVVRVLKACDSDDPMPLTETLLVRFSQDLDRASVDDAAEILLTLASSSPHIQNHFQALVDELRSIVVAEVGSLSVLNIARVCEALAGLNALDTSTLHILEETFLLHLDDACVRSLAIMSYACNDISFSLAAADRSLFLASRFSTGELYAVMKPFFVELSKVEGSYRHSDDTPSTEEATAEGSPSSALTLSGNKALQRDHSLVEDFGRKPLRAEERLAAEAQRRQIGSVLCELTQQLQLHLDSATTNIEPHVLLGILKGFADCCDHADLFGSHYRRAVHSMCGRVISCARRLPIESLVEFLVIANALGQQALHASVVAIVEAIRQKIAGGMIANDDASVLSSRNAALLYNMLGEMTQLNPLQRRKVDAELLPLLRQRVSHDDKDMLKV